MIPCTKIAKEINEMKYWKFFTLYQVQLQNSPISTSPMAFLDSSMCIPDLIQIYQKTTGCHIGMIFLLRNSAIDWDPIPLQYNYFDSSMLSTHVEILSFQLCNRFRCTVLCPECLPSARNHLTRNHLPIQHEQSLHWNKMSKRYKLLHMERERDTIQNTYWRLKKFTAKMQIEITALVIFTHSLTNI